MIQMKNITLILITSLLILSWCSTIPTAPSVWSWSTPTQLQATWDVQEPLVENLSWTNGEYTLFFDDEHMSKTFTLYHNSDQHTTVSFINDGYKSLSVAVNTANETGVNIRLAQIIMPDGSQDGPFGSETMYDLTQNGWYQLVFHENMMAGNPWSGNVQVTISVKK